MKKLINEPENAVPDALRGLAAAHPELTVDVANRFVVRGSAGADTTRPAVALVSGGGSGHEPLHTGFVGYGMLDAACPGEMFTSPVPDQILAATEATQQAGHGEQGGGDVLYVVKNYTGDVLNFQMAAELAGDEDIAVETVIVADDVAVEDSTHTAGRRGTGGTLFVEKIAGALAEEGGDLATVAATATDVSERSRSFGVALTPCTVPTAGEPGFQLAEDEIELGIGIHGEPGRQRAKLVPAVEMVGACLDAIEEDMSLAGELLVLVSGMGGTPLSELYVAYGEVARSVERRGGTITRSLVGNYVTSLEMAGCMISVCRLTPELTRLWDAPVATPALRWGR